MPIDPSVENMLRPAEKGKDKEGSAGGSASGKTAGEGMDFAYEFVSVSQVRESCSKVLALC